MLLSLLIFKYLGTYQRKEISFIFWKNRKSTKYLPFYIRFRFYFGFNPININSSTIFSNQNEWKINSQNKVCVTNDAFHYFLCILWGTQQQITKTASHCILIDRQKAIWTTNVIHPSTPLLTWTEFIVKSWDHLEKCI